jgi:hypothetical protein
MLLVPLVALALGSSPVADRYFEAARQLQARRETLARAPEAKALPAARQALLTAFDAELAPAWEGTPWEFYGTSQTPGQGAIACGYYVSTILRDAGFRLERVRLAQQASEHIVKTFAAEQEIQRFRDADLAALVAAVRHKHGEGLFIVGMDYHVGLLRLTKGQARLCHSAVLAPRHAVCEDAVTSPGMVSRYHVVGPALSDARVRDWLAGRALPTALPARASARR